jgi:hypothetical protein
MPPWVVCVLLDTLFEIFAATIYLMTRQEETRQKSEPDAMVEKNSPCAPACFSSMCASGVRVRGRSRAIAARPHHLAHLIKAPAPDRELSHSTRGPGQHAKSSAPIPPPYNSSDTSITKPLPMCQNVTLSACQRQREQQSVRDSCLFSVCAAGGWRHMSREKSSRSRE